MAIMVEHKTDFLDKLKDGYKVVDLKSDLEEQLESEDLKIEFNFSACQIDGKEESENEKSMKFISKVLQHKKKERNIN